MPSPRRPCYALARRPGRAEEPEGKGGAPFLHASRRGSVTGNRGKRRCASSRSAEPIWAVEHRLGGVHARAKFSSFSGQTRCESRNRHGEEPTGELTPHFKLCLTGARGRRHYAHKWGCARRPWIARRDQGVRQDTERARTGCETTSSANPCAHDSERSEEARGGRAVPAATTGSSALNCAHTYARLMVRHARGARPHAHTARNRRVGRLARPAHAGRNGLDPRRYRRDMEDERLGTWCRC
eukprot:scaffold14555_cov29-Tisochrysis_lutea.AAC.1